MESSVGRLQPLALDRPVDDGLLGQVEAGLTEQLGERRQAAAMVSFMAAVPFCPADETFSVARVGRAIPPPRRQTTRQLRYLLDEEAWSADELRLALLSSAVAAGAEAIFLECREISRKGIAPYDIVNLSLLGRDFCCPVGWLRARMGSQRIPGAMEIGEAERTAAAVLLAQLCDDLERLGLAAGFVPLFASDSRYGEMPGLREDLDALGFEYVLGLDPTYNSGFEGPGHPDDPFLVERELLEQMPFGLQGELPEPRPVPPGPEPSPPGEFFIPYRRDGLPAYAIGLPRVALRSGDLTGYRAINRARLIGRLMEETQAPKVADNVRLVSFLHSPEAGWQAGALLLSILYAALQGLFPERGA